MNPVSKAAGYLHRNGAAATMKKIAGRLVGTGWLSPVEDALYTPQPFVVPGEERWEMPLLQELYPGTVSVILPCYNGAMELPELLEQLDGQTGVGHLELVIIDSGSTDGSDVLAEQAGARVVRIPQSAFTHSYARNLGAKHATGEYLLFMTQDARPDRKDWILSLLQPALLGGAAAVSCLERPRPDADLISRVTAWNWRRVMLGDADRLTQLPEDMRFDSLRRCAMLSDNACLIRADVYRNLGGHRGAYAEDLDLGIRLLQAGERLCVLGSVSVIHSHTREPLYDFKRAAVDALQLKKLFSDFPLDTLRWSEAYARSVVAACAAEQFICVLRECPPADTSPDTLCAYARSEWEKTLTALRKASHTELEARSEALVEQTGDTYVFVRKLRELAGEQWRFDAALAVSVARYLMHTVSGYLRETNTPADSAVLEALPALIRRYLAQSAGYAAAACCGADDARVQEFIESYCTGV